MHAIVKYVSKVDDKTIQSYGQVITHWEKYSRGKYNLNADEFISLAATKSNPRMLVTVARKIYRYCGWDMSVFDTVQLKDMVRKARYKEAKEEPAGWDRRAMNRQKRGKLNEWEKRAWEATVAAGRGAPLPPRPTPSDLAARPEARDELGVHESTWRKWLNGTHPIPARFAWVWYPRPCSGGE